MAYIFGLIARLLHCAQAKPVDHIFRGRAEGSGNDFAGASSAGWPFLDYSGRQVFTAVAWSVAKKRGQPLFLPAPDAPGKEKGIFDVERWRGHGLAGRDHELFDQFVGVVSFRVAHPGNGAVFRKTVLRLRQVKVQGSALLSHPWPGIL